MERFLLKIGSDPSRPVAAQQHRLVQVQWGKQGDAADRE